ncbi:heat shock 70 kDa protein 12A-like [Pecten maximus]|uniref:heat shock 70 kDa protein 12A-like n=1 Tax=Pecten maximus TaxID=6579 RepID=UPI00145886B7|nr:heat shock 70 kDa protein 12A-like [Pecten maximus]
MAPYNRVYDHKQYGDIQIRSITRESILKDDKGKPLNAMTVFSTVVSHLRQDALSKINERSDGPGFKEDDIRWVLTAPAIWSDQAKQFMREAANKAGIRSCQLDIALEPEAASIHCKHISVNKRGPKDEEDCAGMESFRPGTKYMVLEAGGGAGRRHTPPSLHGERRQLGRDNATGEGQW